MEIVARWSPVTVVALLLLWAAPGWAADVLQGRVVKVSDGDTVTLLSNGAEIRIRLWGIDAPEKSQAFGQASKKKLIDLVAGRDVRVESRGTDRYGRTVGWILLGQTAVNLEQVRAGMAWWYTQYAPKASDLRDAEVAARKGKIGLWQDAAPMPPWLYRKAKRNGEQP